MLFQESFNSGYVAFDIPASYADYHSFNRCLYNPSYRHPPPPPTNTLPPQPRYVWNIRDSFQQSPAPPPMAPYVGTVPSRASEPVSARPTEEFYQPQVQVSLPVMSILRVLV